MRPRLMTGACKYMISGSRLNANIIIEGTVDAAGEAHIRVSSLLLLWVLIHRRD